MIQKIGYFHSFALNTSRASGDIVSSRDTEKKYVWGLGNGKVRRGGGRGVCWQLCSSVRKASRRLVFFPGLAWGAGAATCQPCLWPFAREGEGS